VTGIVVSSAGLTALTYGLIKAGDSGWANPAAVSTIAAGAAAIAGFVVWERWISRSGAAGSPDGARAGRPPQPLIDLELFGSAGFTWGTVLSTLVSFALFGLVFAMPQYFLDVRGFNSLGAGLRMLPMIGGLVVGLLAGQRLQTPGRRARSRGQGAEGTLAAAGAPAPAGLVGPKALVAAGFAVMAAALALGATTTAASTTGFAATWFALTGLGLGIAMPTALNAALGALSAARSGSGSALITAMRQVGGTIGVAVLGTVLASVYRSGLHLAGLPSAAEHAIRSSVAGGVAAAQSSGSQVLLETVRGAYVHGLDVMLWACSGIAITSALLALAFLPGRAQSPGEAESAVSAGVAGSAVSTGAE